MMHVKSWKRDNVEKLEKEQEPAATTRLEICLYGPKSGDSVSDHELLMGHCIGWRDRLRKRHKAY